MENSRKIVTALLCIILPFKLFGWTEMSAEPDTVLPSNMVEAESGALGADFSVETISGDTAITITTDLINTFNPGSEARVATYLVEFPEAGIYELYARLRVGPNTYDDDSQFIPVDFGIMDPVQDTAWYRVNGLASAGYTASGDIVDGSGNAGSGVWKWVNLSRFAEGPGDRTYMVTGDTLVKIFQVGARENGLYMDKFVFGKSGLYFSVETLDNGDPGFSEYPRSGTPIAEGQEKYLGSGYDDIQAPGFEAYWDQITPGNAGKWGSVEWTRDQMNWAALDKAYLQAERYNMLFKEHTLLWGAQQPGWMNDLDSAQQRQEIEEWFAAIADRYDSIDMIDVVNEPIHNAPNGMVPWGTTEPNIDYAGALGGGGETGHDWIIEAFRLARQYFPVSKLILNEYSVINSNETTSTMIGIVNLLKAEGLIDGIGEQAHAFTTRNVSTELLQGNLDRLGATGIPIHISEFDIDGYTDHEQLQEYIRVFPLFWEHPAVEGVTLWGYRYGLWRNDEGAFIIDQEGNERPAMTWLKAYVNDTLKLVEEIVVTSKNDSTVIREPGGTLKLQAAVMPDTATIKNVFWSVSDGLLAGIDQ